MEVQNLPSLNSDFGLKQLQRELQLVINCVFLLLGGFLELYC